MLFPDEILSLVLSAAIFSLAVLPARGTDPCSRCGKSCNGKPCVRKKNPLAKIFRERMKKR